MADSTIPQAVKPVTPTSQSTAENNFSEKGAVLEKVVSGHHPDVEDHGDAQPHVHMKTYLAVFAVFMIYAAQLFAIVGAGTQGTAISTHFGRSADVVWVVAPITIMTTVLGPIISQASDYWGRKWFLIVPTLVGALGSLVVSRANSMNMVIAGTSLIGIAFGAQPLLHTVASEVLPRRWRSWAQSTVMISNVFGAILALMIGGSLTRHGDPNAFRTYFYIAVALFALTALICVFTYNPLPTKSQLEFTLQEKLARLDWIGYALLAASIVLFSLGLFWSKNPYEWNDAHVSATFSIGLALGIALVLYETLVKKDGMFHHGLFSNNRNFTVALICVFCEGVAFFAFNVYFSFETGVIYTADTLINNVRFAVMFLTSLVVSLLIGVYTTAKKQVRFPTVIAFLLFTIFFGCMVSANLDSGKPVWFYPALLGAGLGMCLILLVTVAQLSTPPELIATASGLIISVRSLGGTIAVAIYNTVFTAGMAKLPGNLAAAAIEAGLPQSSVTQFVGGLADSNTTLLMSTPGVTSAIIGAGADALLDTYLKGFRSVWITAIPFVALAAIAALFLIDPVQEFNSNIDAPVEKDADLYSLEK